VSAAGTTALLHATGVRISTGGSPGLTKTDRSASPIASRISRHLAGAGIAAAIADADGSRNSDGPPPKAMSASLQSRGARWITVIAGWKIGFIVGAMRRITRESRDVTVARRDCLLDELNFEGFSIPRVNFLWNWRCFDFDGDFYLNARGNWWVTRMHLTCFKTSQSFRQCPVAGRLLIALFVYRSARKAWQVFSGETMKRAQSRSRK